MSKKVTGISVARNGIAHIKSPVVMLHVAPNIIEPLVYLRKPKNVSDSQFKAVVEDISSQIVGLNTHTVSKLEEDNALYGKGEKR